MQIKIVVGPEHVMKGKCSNEQRCAIAQALANTGFKGATVGGSSISFHNKYDELDRTLITTSPLNKTAQKFIGTFDAIEDFETAKQSREARKALAAKLAKKPLVVTVKLTDAEAKQALKKKAYARLTA